jgi:hypothetical protein
MFFAGWIPDRLKKIVSIQFVSGEKAYVKIGDVDNEVGNENRYL